MVCLQAALWGNRAIEQALKDPARHARHALVFTNADAELDRLTASFQRASSGKLKNIVPSSIRDVR